MTGQTCTKCVMDSSDEKIFFDEKGICNHCHRYDNLAKKKVLIEKDGPERLKKIFEEIKEDGKDKKYDCVIGISGGVDSTYVVHLAKENGLRPLAVHLDNGWNTKTATRNISKILRKLGVELRTHVINWEEFRDLQLAYLKASVIDIEAITDHAIKAAEYKIAAEEGIKYILTGVNFTTEGVMPKNWGYNKNDYINIKDIHKKFGKTELKTFPFLTLWDRLNYQVIKGIKMIEPLNFIPYNKEKVTKMLSEKYGWEPYKGKHGESLFTYFYQTYILPKKFGVDKRKAHLSALICAKQLSREKALEELSKPICSEEDLNLNKEYVLKKFGISEKEFEKIMKNPLKKHNDYKSLDKFLRKLRKFYLAVSPK